jgi:hypothetical protein
MNLSTGLPRRVEAELLDDLAAHDPRAQRSRDDLRRLHRAMGTLSIALRALDRATMNSSPRTILELGAGDGSMMLRFAQRRAARWPGVELTMLDRLDLVDTSTLNGLRNAGWTPNVVAMDVFEWLAKPTAAHQDARWDIVFANLFMHHFSPDALDRLLPMIAARCRIFFCCEPLRSVLPLAASHLVGLLGAGPVTRVDAVLSVHAGFRAQELSALWPDHHAWQLREYRAGLFSHGFLATREDARA